MSLFLITFLALYGAMHAYAFHRVKGAFSPSRATLRTIAVLMVLMTIMPVLVRLSELVAVERMAMMLAWPGYIWMGALFLFVSALLLADLIRFIARLISRKSGSSLPECLDPHLNCEIALIFALCATIYSFYEARTIRTEHLTVATSKLPAAVKGIRVVQISDVHLGLLVREERLGRILKQVKAAAPDILVSTGDLVDGRLNRQGALDIHGKLAEMLASVNAPLGKFAVTGNHEFYAGIDQALDFTRKAGFRVLRNETVSAGSGISIAGRDDPAAKRLGLTVGGPNERISLNGTDPGRYIILLKHRPLVEKTSDGMPDLQLSGHTHQGQIFPFTLLVRLEYPLTGGTATAAAGSKLHVSRGSGTWGPPLRFLSPPEVTVIDIVPAR